MKLGKLQMEAFISLRLKYDSVKNLGVGKIAPLSPETTAGSPAPWWLITSYPATDGRLPPGKEKGYWADL
jgi:hypothetical protein